MGVINSILIKSEEGYMLMICMAYMVKPFTDIDDKEKAREKLMPKVIYPDTNFVLMKVVSSTSDDDDIPF